MEPWVIITLVNTIFNLIMLLYSLKSFNSGKEQGPFSVPFQLETYESKNSHIPAYLVNIVFEGEKHSFPVEKQDYLKLLRRDSKYVNVLVREFPSVLGSPYLSRYQFILASDNFKKKDKKAIIISFILSFVLIELFGLAIFYQI